MRFERSGGDEIKSLRPDASQREFGAHTAAFGQKIAQSDAAGRLRHAIGEDGIEPAPRAFTRNLTLGERRHIHKADVLVHVSALFAHELEIVRTTKAPFFTWLLAGPNAGMILVQKDVGLVEIRLAQPVALWRKPVRPLPTVDGAEYGAEVLHTRIARRLAHQACGRPLLVRIMHGEDLGVGLLVLLDQIARIRVGTEAARVDAKHIDCRFASDDPLGKLPAGAAGRRHAE